MEKKKNIIFLSGIDSYGVSLELMRWKKRFRESQDGLNIDTFRIEEVKNWNEVENEILSVWLFADKRLFCFSGGSSPKSEKNFGDESTKATSKKDLKWAEAEEKLIKICESLPDDHFIIFSHLELSIKSSKLMKWLDTYADKRSFIDIWSITVWENRFPTIWKSEIEKVVTAYKKAESGRENTRETLSDAIGNSLEKLSLIKLSRPITKTDVEDSILTESSGKIFDFSDAILRGDASGSLELFRDIIQSTNIYAFVPLLIGILRGSMYIKSLKNGGKTEREISNLITVNPYILWKSYNTRISYEKLREFYEKILSVNIAYRSGKGMKDPELWRIFAIELAIIGLKK